MAHFERKTGGRLVYDGRVVKLHVDEVVLENSSPAVREYVSHIGGATVLAVVDGGIVFVEQFRYPYGEVVLELPAGKREIGEDPAVTARRELEEETGYFAQNLTFLGEVYPSPGYTDERLFLYFAEGLERRNQHTDEDEFLSVKVIPVDKVEEMVYSGEIKDAKTLIAVLKYLQYYKDKH